MHRVILSFLVSFMLLMAVIAINRVTYNREQAYSKQTEHSRNIIKLYDNLTIHLRSAELYSPTYENSSAKGIYDIYRSDIDRLQPELLQLRDSIRDNYDQVLIVDSIDALLQQLLPVLRKKNIPEMISSEEALFPNLLKAHHLIQQGLDAEEFLLKSRRKELRKFNQLNNIFTLLVAVFAIL